MQVSWARPTFASTVRGVAHSPAPRDSQGTQRPHTSSRSCASSLQYGVGRRRLPHKQLHSHVGMTTGVRVRGAGQRVSTGEGGWNVD
jgi:hypothetical protein